MTQASEKTGRTAGEPEKTKGRFFSANLQIESGGLTAKVATEAKAGEGGELGWRLQLEGV